jgi:hypothetical protein
VGALIRLIVSGEDDEERAPKQADEPDAPQHDRGHRDPRASLSDGQPEKNHGQVAARDVERADQVDGHVHVLRAESDQDSADAGDQQGSEPPHREATPRPGVQPEHQSEQQHTRSDEGGIHHRVQGRADEGPPEMAARSGAEVADAVVEEAVGSRPRRLDDSLRDEEDQGQEPADAGQPYSIPGVWPELL